MTTGIVPYELKKAIVIPLFKNGDPNIFNNYRPISLLPIFSKVMEKVIYARCISFLKKTTYYMNISLASEGIIPLTMLYHFYLKNWPQHMKMVKKLLVCFGIFQKLLIRSIMRYNNS